MTTKMTIAQGYPELAAQWHPTLNGDLTPDMVTAGSNKTCWWLCDKGHTWTVQMKHRVRGQGCPYCSGRLPTPGETDLATTHPGLAAQWHPTLNGDLTPDIVTAGSNKKLWWRCENGHVWEAMVCTRVTGTGCPYCSGRLPIPGETDLATTHPALAAQWHPTLNGDLTPDIVSAGSMKKPWWLCENGHAWTALVKDRVGGRGCPTCWRQRHRGPKSGRILSFARPDLAAQWHPVLNEGATPDMVTTGSNRKPWWLCEKGHAWKAAIADRVRGSDCPYCSGLLPTPGETDLATTHPDLAAQWHPTLNGGLTPSMVSAGSSKRKPWWLCKNDHTWQSSVFDRARGKGCPYCSGLLPIAGETDLVTTHPELAARWHPTLNSDLTPDAVTAGSHRKPWWVCENGHAWTARIRDRVRGSDCPYCSGLLPTPSETDLATTHPELAAQWHPTLNSDLTPDMVSAGSDKKPWWLCENGHEWSATVKNRTCGTGCPECCRLTRTATADATP